MEKLSASFVIGLLIAITLASPISAQFAPRGSITIVATDFRTNDGRLRCFLYDQPDAFPTHPDRAYAGALGRLSGGRASCTFQDVPPGRYAIALHHDQNMDGRVDTGIFGIPTEGLGASNDAHGSMGPPSFEAAAFEYTGSAVTMSAHIGYVF